jgi:hypothetical protein
VHIITNIIPFLLIISTISIQHHSLSKGIGFRGIDDGIWVGEENETLLETMEREEQDEDHQKFLAMLEKMNTIKAGGSK